MTLSGEYELVQAQHLYQTNGDWRFSETVFLVMDLIFAKALLALDVCPDLGAEIHIRRQARKSRDESNPRTKPRMSLLVDDEDEQLHTQVTSKEQEKILPLIAADLDRNKEIASDCFWSDHEIIV